MDSNNQNNPTQNNEPQSKDLQLENETPMDLTVKFDEPIEEPKPFSISSQPTQTYSIQPDVKMETTTSSEPILKQAQVEPQPITPQPTLPPQPNTISEEISNPIQYTLPKDIPNDTPANTISNPLQNLEFSKSKDISNPGIQKIMIIAGALLGVLIVVGVGFIFFSNNNQASTSTQDEVTNITQSQAIVPITTPVTNTLETQSALSLTEYQSIVGEIETSTNSILVKYPINLSQNKIDPESVRFASEELFSNYQKIIELKFPENAKASNEKLASTYQSLYQSYDLILKTFKESNTITQEARSKFTTEYNQAQTNLKNIFLEIKNLK